MTLLHRIEAAAARAALRLLRTLGPVRASNLCGAIARTLGPWLPVSRIAYANLRAAMPELDEATRRRIVRGVWDNLGRTAGELPHLAHLRPTSSGPGWELVGAEALQPLLAEAGPAILFSGHIGNWEALPVAAAAAGIPFHSMYRTIENPALDRMLLDLRRQAMRSEVGMFAKGAAGAVAAMRHLRAGGRLGMLMDQKMNDGIPARFFGHPAMTAPALAVLALRLRCPVIPGWVERTGPARFRVTCEMPLALPDTGNRDQDIATLTQAVNDRLEAWVRLKPESWLWLHRRWPKEALSASSPSGRRPG